MKKWKRINPRYPFPAIFYDQKYLCILRLKVGLSSSKKVCFICSNESPFNIMKNGFYFMLKAFFFLKIIKFLSETFFVMEENDLVRKLRLVSNNCNTHIAQYLTKKWQLHNENLVN